MIIRDAIAEEFPFIREQLVRSYVEHSKRIPVDHWNTLKKAITSENDTQPGVERIVAEIDGTIVGSVALFPAKIDAYGGQVDMLDYPEIRMLGVSKEARGQGIAKALITECIRRSKAKGHTAIGLHTGDFMEAAQRLYEQLGFVRLPQFDFIPLEDGIVVKAYRLLF